jgi:N-acetylmuramoyl-L-alanine amidase
MRSIDLIVIHCTATRPSQDIGVRELRKWHTEDRGFTDVGYHYVVRRDGTVEDGRPEPVPGAHARGHNQNSIGIVLCGGVDDRGTPDFNFSFKQLEALNRLVGRLVDAYGELAIVGHRDLSNKACPCFDVGEFFQ